MIGKRAGIPVGTKEDAVIGTGIIRGNQVFEIQHCAVKGFYLSLLNDNFRAELFQFLYKEIRAFFMCSGIAYPRTKIHLGLHIPVS